MFDIGWGELVVIGIVALIAIGPKELPTVLRSLGQWMGKIKRMANEFQGQFQEALREAEMADLKKQADELTSAVTDATKFDPLADIDKTATDGRGRRARRRNRRRASRTERAGSAAPQPPREPSGRAPRRGRSGLPPIDVPPPEAPAPVTEKDFAPVEPPPPKRPSRPGARHEPRRHRGQQSAVDGSPDRAALAADQGADRLRADLRALLRLRQGHLQRAGVALRLGGGAGAFEIHLHRAARIFHHPAQARHVRRRLPVVSGGGGADLHVRRARAL